MKSLVPLAKQFTNIETITTKEKVTDQELTVVQEGFLGGKITRLGDKKFQLSGYSLFLPKLKENFANLEKLLAETSQIKYPEEWDHKFDNQPYKAIALQSNSEEFKMVQKPFMSTINGRTIQRVQRIQNNKLWKRFSAHKEELRKEYEGQDVKLEMLLFHGTRNTQPDQIYGSEEGFDLRFAKETGCWGRGNYFSTTAQYSDGYKSTIPGTHQYQMFLARVLTGKSFKTKSDPTLTRPPDIKKGRLYDSVNSGTNIYISYTNYKAYPAYLITYT